MWLTSRKHGNVQVGFCDVKAFMVVRDVRRSLSPFYFVATKHHLVTLQWSGGQSSHAKVKLIVEYLGLQCRRGKWGKEG